MNELEFCNGIYDRVAFQDLQNGLAELGGRATYKVKRNVALGRIQVCGLRVTYCHAEQILARSTREATRASAWQRIVDLCRQAGLTPVE